MPLLSSSGGQIRFLVETLLATSPVSQGLKPEFTVRVVPPTEVGGFHDKVRRNELRLYWS